MRFEQSDTVTNPVESVLPAQPAHKEVPPAEGVTSEPPIERSEETERPEAGIIELTQRIQDANQVITLLTEARSGFSQLVRDGATVSPEVINRLASELAKTSLYSDKPETQMRRRVVAMFEGNSFDDKIDEVKRQKTWDEESVGRLQQNVRDEEQRSQELLRATDLAERIKSGSNEGGNAGETSEK